MKDHNYAVIMAGGVGSRFWPASTKDNPKQFQDILGCGKSLLQTTFERLSKNIPFDNILILTNRIYQDLVLEQLPEVKPSNIVLEPVMRNTAPCILLAALKIWKMDPEARMLVAPSDHWIQGEQKFNRDMNTAFEALESDDKLITFGIPPLSPNTGYGYIQQGSEINKGIRPVKRFTEKPDLETAQKFLKEGSFLWNSGIFVWNTRGILKRFESELPEMYHLFFAGLSQLNTSQENIFLEDNFHKAESISIDYGIIEKAENVFVIPASFSWSDLGTWGSIQGELPQDLNENTVVNSRFISSEANGNIIRTKGKKVVFIDGLSDYMVLEDDDVLVIVPREKEQEIKEIRQRVLDQYGEHLG